RKPAWCTTSSSKESGAQSLTSRCSPMNGPRTVTRDQITALVARPGTAQRLREGGDGKCPGRISPNWYTSPIRRACIMMQEVYTVMHADYAHDRRRPASRGQRARGQGWGECQPACRGGDPVRFRPQGGPERVRQYIAADGRRPTSARHRPGQQRRPAGRHGASDVILCDVNVFIYAHKRGAPGHERYHQWLIDTLNHDEPVAVSDIVLSSFIRIVTHQRVFDPP